MEVKIEVNRQNIMDGLIVLQLILLLILGGYTMSLSRKINRFIEGGPSGLEGAPSNFKGPTAPPPNAPAAAANFKVTKDDHVSGNPNAPVTIVEFSDVECPFCGRHHPTMKQLMDVYAGKVKWVYKHFPLTNIHPNAMPGALALECAAEQGKFWPYLDKLFENQSKLSKDYMKEAAKLLGLNTSKFNNCFDTAKYQSKVDAQIQEAVSSGVEGTPASFVNGQLISGAVPYEQFAVMIDKLLVDTK